MGAEEGARFDTLLAVERQKLLQIGRQTVALQAFPISNPDAIPKRQFQKKKTHGKANARGLSGAEITGKELKAREAREAISVRERIPEDDGQVLVAQTLPRTLAGEYQGGTTITLSIRTPEAIRRPPPSQQAPAWRLFPAEEVTEELTAPPASTAPLKLAGDGERTKRKRSHL
jgi:hypothetical protein